MVSPALPLLGFGETDMMVGAGMSLAVTVMTTSAVYSPAAGREVPEKSARAPKAIFVTSAAGVPPIGYVPTAVVFIVLPGKIPTN